MQSARVHRGATVSTEVAFPPYLEWMKKARCLRQGIPKFYLPGRPTPKEYQRVKDRWCLPCPVRAECLVAVMRQELKARQTSRGVQGGATPAERSTLRRKIRESGICVTIGVQRWLQGLPIPRPLSMRSNLYTVTLTNPDTNTIVYEHTANTPKGAHLIAVRERTRQGDQLLGQVYCRHGHLIEVLPPTDQGEPRSYPCPEQ